MPHRVPFLPPRGTGLKRKAVLVDDLGVGTKPGGVACQGLEHVSKHSLP